MKNAKFFLVTLLVGVFNHSWGAHTPVQIGNLYYILSGTSASVTYINKTGGSVYTDNSYIIPPVVSYGGLDYTVDKIGDYAFAPMYGNDINYGRSSSNASIIVLPNTIKSIGAYAFYNCKNLTRIIIPSSVQSIGSSSFLGCNTLREIIYLPSTAPTNWVATDLTYVPDKQSYSSPSQTINNPCVYGMISFGQSEFDYTGQRPTTSWVNNVEGYIASLSMPVLNREAGIHEEWIPVTFTKDDESFAVDVVYRYTIKPVKLSAKVDNASREYGEENPNFALLYTGFITGENESVITTQPTISTTATKTSNVGDYPITISGGVAANYEFVYEPGVLTITKAPLSAKVDDATKIYGSLNPAFTIEYYGLKNDETTPAWSKTPTFQTEATQSSCVGKYEVKAVNGVPINYDLGEITAGTLTVTPASLTIKANDATRQYFSDDPSFGYTCNGFVNGENEEVLSPKPTLATSANKSSSVGTYPIKASEASNSNYSISYVDGTLTITHRTLYASVGNYERLYNEDNPDFEVTYDGFVENEDENLLITKATASTTATKTSDVGSYSIDVTGGSADNYKFSYTSGTLTINKAEQAISWEQDLSNLKVGDQVELRAVASSGLSITYNMDSNDVAEIYSAGNNKTYLDCKAEGQFTIRATQEGNKNYYSSTRVSKTVTIGNGESAVKSLENLLAKIQRTPYGIRVTNANIGDVIQVYSADGILHRSVKVEGEMTDIRLSNGIVYVVKVGTRTMKIGL